MAEEPKTLQLQYGSYVHEVGEVELSITQNALMGDSGNPYARRIEISLNGTLVADNTAEMDAKATALLLGYQFPNQDFLVINEKGVAQRLSLYTADTLGGVQIISPPSFPSNKDAAYVTFLPYQIELAAEVAYVGPETVLLKFNETLDFSGGGPAFAHLETRFGLPQPQALTNHTTYKVTQAGSATGLYATPTPPAPMWPGSQVIAPRINKIGGRLVGAGSSARFMYKGVRWSYQFESAFPFFGEPNHWGNE